MGCVGSKSSPNAGRPEDPAAAGPAAQPSTSTRGAASGRTPQAAGNAARGGQASPGAAPPDDPIYTTRLAATGQPKELRSGLLAAVEVTAAGATQDFFIESNLGHGSFGEVFRARHRTDSSKAVALKIMARDRIKVTSIQREFAVMEAMGMHPGIVGYYGCYKTEDKVVFVLELMNGGELFERLVHKGAYTEAEARPAFRRVARALAYLHSRGIVHRDLKPENLLLKEDSYSSEIKVADFGLSQLIRSSERLVKVCGTWAYAAPEMSDPTRPGYDTRFDTWGFGVILSVVLTGFHPFDPEGGLPVDTIKHRARNAIWSFDQPEWQSISPQARDLIAKLIVKDPSRRLSSAEMVNHPWLRDTTPIPAGVSLAPPAGAVDADGPVVAPPFDPALWLTRTERVRSRGAPPSSTIPPPGDPDDLLREAARFLAIPGAFGKRRHRKSRGAGQAAAAGTTSAGPGAGASAVVLGGTRAEQAVAAVMRDQASGVSSAAPPTTASLTDADGAKPSAAPAPAPRDRQPPPASEVPELSMTTTSKRAAIASRSARRPPPAEPAPAAGRAPALSGGGAPPALVGSASHRHEGAPPAAAAVREGQVLEVLELAPGVAVPSHRKDGQGAAAGWSDPRAPRRPAADRLAAFQDTMRKRQRQRAARHHRRDGDSDTMASPHAQPGRKCAEPAANQLLPDGSDVAMLGGAVRRGGAPTGAGGLHASRYATPCLPCAEALPPGEEAAVVVVMVGADGGARPVTFSQRLNADGTIQALVPVDRRPPSPPVGSAAGSGGPRRPRQLAPIAAHGHAAAPHPPPPGPRSPLQGPRAAPSAGTHAARKHRRAGTASAPHRGNAGAAAGGTPSMEFCASSVSSAGDGLRPPAVINAHGCGWEVGAMCGSSSRSECPGSEEMSPRDGGWAGEEEEEKGSTGSSSESMLSEGALRQRLARQRPTVPVLAARGDDDLSSASLSARSEELLEDDE